MRKDDRGRSYWDEETMAAVDYEFVGPAMNWDDCIAYAFRFVHSTFGDPGADGTYGFTIDSRSEYVGEDAWRQGLYTDLEQCLAETFEGHGHRLLPDMMHDGPEALSGWSLDFDVSKEDVHNVLQPFIFQLMSEDGYVARVWWPGKTEKEVLEDAMLRWVDHEPFERRLKELDHE